MNTNTKPAHRGGFTRRGGKNSLQEYDVPMARQTDFAKHSMIF